MGDEKRLVTFKSLRGKPIIQKGNVLGHLRDIAVTTDGYVLQVGFEPQNSCMRRYVPIDTIGMHSGAIYFEGNAKDVENIERFHNSAIYLEKDRITLSNGNSYKVVPKYTTLEEDLRRLDTVCLSAGISGLSSPSDISSMTEFFYRSGLFAHRDEINYEHKLAKASERHIDDKMKDLGRKLSWATFRPQYRNLPMVLKPA